MAGYSRVQTACLSILVTTLLSGCATSFDPLANTSPGQSSLDTISGTAYGGRQPISGAHVYLLEANNAHDAGPGSAGSSNQSKSLLNSAAGNGPDSIGYYVVTDKNGTFSLTGTYTACDTGEQVYLYSVGGDAGGGVNSAAGLMAVLGTCGSFPFTSSTKINMNEVSTIAAAYAMAGYANDATHVGYDGTALAKLGITNAFANANQLFDITTNPDNAPNTQARATTPNGNGTVPQKQINTLANIIAACVDSAGPTFSQCTTVLGGLKSAGATGTQATDTATEAIYMAHNPSITSIYNATGSGPNPYTNWYNTVAPPDLTIAISYTGNGYDRYNDPSSYPGTLAIDASNNVWIINDLHNTVSAFNHLGVPLSGSPFSGNGMAHPEGIAVDTSGRIWVPNAAANGNNQVSVSIFNASGSANSDPVDNGSGCVNVLGNIAFDPSGNAWMNQIGGFGVCKVNNTFTTYNLYQNSNLQNPIGIASDASGNIWIANQASGFVNKLNATGANVNGSPFAGSQIGVSYGLAVDANNNAWIAASNNMVEITSGGSVGSAITGGGIVEPNAVAVDGANHIWVTDYGTYGTGAPNGDGNIVELNSSGALMSGSAGYQSGSAFTGQSIAIDGSGDVWVDNQDAPSAAVSNIRELIGAAAPVTTPLSAATTSNKLGQRP